MSIYLFQGGDVSHNAVAKNNESMATDTVLDPDVHMTEQSAEYYNENPGKELGIDNESYSF